MQCGFIEAEDFEMVGIVLVEVVIGAERDQVLAPAFPLMGGLAVITDKSEADTSFHTEVVGN